MPARDPQITNIEIGDLAGLDLIVLRKHWRRLYRCDPPARMSRELMMQAVGYRLQEDRHGGLSRAMKLRLAEAGKVNGSKKATARPRASVRRTVKPGTRFLREWQGRTHEVTTTGDGRFLYRDTTYSSLSAIARAITGTRWSGPAFFGIRDKGRENGQERHRI